MSTAVAYSNEEVSSFVEALGQLSDDRDRRGKRHSLTFGKPENRGQNTVIANISRNCVLTPVFSEALVQHWPARAFCW
jgi:hypothetical protein